jgi:amidohydrolase
MIDGGVLDRIAADRMVTAHLASPMPSGLVAARDGLAMAGADLIRIRLEGAGGHGALAPTYGNVVLAAARLVQTMPELVRDISYEGIGCVCSAGALHAGTAANVVPRSARVEGTLRTFLPEQRELLLARLRDECARTFDSSGVTATLEIVSSMPPVINDNAIAARVRAAAARCLKSAVLEPPPLTPSDDVSEFMNRIPGCHMFIGAAPSSGLPPMHHAPDFDFDERALAVGVVALCAAAIELVRVG